MFKCVVVAAVVAAVSGIEITDEQYYSMPPLFLLDDYDECLSRPKGVFCLGTFDLLQNDNGKLYTFLQQYTTDVYHFNRTKIHRGYCLPKTCSHIAGIATPRRKFQQCVNNITKIQYRLEANLSEFQYCTTKSGKSVDTWDVAFACICGVVLLLNLVGTVYDLMRKEEGKPIKLLMAWSVIANWRRLTADHSGGDPRLSALKPVQGMKAMTLILIMLAHTVLAFHYIYLYNPQFLEKAGKNALSVYLQNGTCIVQTFIMISSFLLAYNLLIQAADNPKRSLSMRMLPQCLMHRFSRISPLYFFILGLATTWWAHASNGPFWSPLIEDESSRCRDKWWAQALYVSNFVKTDEMCLIHTWFLAVDMQLYVVSAILTLLLGKWPRAAVKILIAMLVATAVVNFGIIYQWELRPMVKLMIPEKIRVQFFGERSFKWLYAAPWDSLPSALVGLLVAFIHHNQQTDGFNPAESKTVRIFYRLSVPCMFAWCFFGGFLMKPVTEPFWIYLFAAVDRPIFISLTALAMYGFFNKVDSKVWKLMSWRGWEILGRMSLSIYLAHWLIALLIMGVRTNLSRVSIFDVGGHWFTTIFLTYWAALPLHLLIELPAMKFLQSITS